jgi:circadian clock protein KaiB
MVNFNTGVIRGSVFWRLNDKAVVMEKPILKLFVTGKSASSRHAIANLRRICAEELKHQYAWEVIDILEQPEQAEVNRILATPTLIKEVPPPARRIIGDLSQTAAVLGGLDIGPEAPADLSGGENND